VRAGDRRDAADPLFKRTERGQICIDDDLELARRREARPKVKVVQVGPVPRYPLERSTVGHDGTLPARLRQLGCHSGHNFGGRGRARTQLTAHHARTVRRVRVLPWLLAVAGLVIPYSQVPDAWPFALGWFLVLGVVWLIGRTIETTRAQRMAAALILLPMLVLLAFEGGWWLIPADLAWLAIEALDRDADQRAVRTMA
jgi:hypothetical protein